MQGALYTRDYLERGIAEEAAWIAIGDAELAQTKKRLLAIFRDFPMAQKPVEGVTEKDLIWPILEALGWADMRVQQNVSKRGREDVPDALLFADGEARRKADAEKDAHQRYRHGLAIVEAKRWNRPLDRADDQGTPSSQMLRYMRRAETATDGKLEWGILTNGRVWRLYWAGASSRAEEFLELDLAAILAIKGFSLDLFDRHIDADLWLKTFILLFRRDSFLPLAESRETFHSQALKTTRKWEAKVTEDLSKTVFEEVFPGLVQGLADATSKASGRATLTDPELEDVRRSALTLLYRLLFVLYAEDRRLLPVDHDGYKNYSLDAMRTDLAERIDRNEVFSATIANRYETLRSVFVAIDKGDIALGLPPYNGGLFDPQQHGLLEKARLPDALVAKTVDALSRRDEGGRRLRINYRDLTVKQLGSIYERLLEFAVVRDDGGKIAIRPNIFARKGSGSYYTPEDLVRLIIDRTLAPLLEERQAAFDVKLGEAKSSRRPKAERIKELQPADPATAFLGLRVCDPAMGSGHFLVSLVDRLADHILTAMADAEVSVREAFGPDTIYRSPIQDRIEAIRKRIAERAKKEGWRVTEAQLDDRHIVRRMILKRVIYGVDKNPMAVELAKVSLWLHTFTVGAPLSFLDHHLRCGDSLFGELVNPVEEYLDRQNFGLPLHQSLVQAKNAAKGMAIVEEMSDADIAEVERSEREFAGVERDTQPLASFLDFFHALRWMERLPKAKGKAKAKAGAKPQIDPVAQILDGSLGDPVQVISGSGPAALMNRPRSGEMFPATKPEQMDIAQRGVTADKFADAKAILTDAKAIAARERFLHWQVAFPGVWDQWESKEPIGGFDAVIGNPPWDRIKLQEVEWFATRRPEIAKQQRASDRAKMIVALRKAHDPLHADYEKAAEAAESAARVARDSKYYPLLSGGDINLYSLFIERAQALIKPDGMTGLLCPSGIAGDKGASEFFGLIATSGRLAGLFDFENRRIRYELPPFFPDVDSRFKFCAFVAGGKDRTFSESACAFFLQSVTELSNPDRCFPLTAKDFARVNPNTKTAPIFRTRRDAQIVRGIYERLPVLHDHSKGDNGKAWPVRYFRMFDMTNDAGHFRTRTELDKEGMYPVDGGRLKKGYVEYVPLYEGKMVQAYDHRAASITINSQNLNRPAQPVPSSDKEHSDSSWSPTPQFWVKHSEVDLPEGTQFVLGYKEITAPTNVRSMIASLFPPVAFGNKVPLLLWSKSNTAERSPQYDSVLLLANLNAFPFDFVVRQKIQGQTLNWFIVEQLPVIPPIAYNQKIGKRKVADLVRDEVLHLTYTAIDMKPFAEDMGYDGKPFKWDEEDRRHRRARLDAIYFRLYGIGEDDAAYILDTFPIVRQQDEKQFGKYRTKEMILAYMRAFTAGDTETRVAV